MKATKRKYGLFSKVKHSIANKKQEWQTERKDLKDMKAEATEKGKQRAREARRKQYEREAEEKYKQRYGVRDRPERSHKSSKPTKSQKPIPPPDPFGFEDFIGKR